LGFIIGFMFASIIGEHEAYDEAQEYAHDCE
jgi:hypothetical protein